MAATKRRTRLVPTAVFLLAAFVIIYHLTCVLLPEGSTAQSLVSALGFPALQLPVLVLCLLAFRKTQEEHGRWVWAMVSLWLVFNAFGDAAWGYYEFTAGTEPPSPGPADLGYLASYAAALAVVLVATLKIAGRTRMLETTLDAAMLTVGAAGISWPFVFAPLLEAGSLGAALWVGLAYPIGDLLIIFAFASFFLGFVGKEGARPRPYYTVLCIAFGFQIVADGAYLSMTASDAAYSIGTWMNPVWLLAYGTAGLAALMEIQASGARDTPAIRDGEAASNDTAPNVTGLTWSSSHWGILLPSLGLPIVAGMLLMELWGSGWRETRSSEGLACLVTILVFMVLARQYVTLSHNRRLNIDLSHASAELREKVDHLAHLNRQLEDLNRAAQVLNTLRSEDEVVRIGLQLACAFHQAPGSWLTLVDDDGRESVAGSHGAIDPDQLPEPFLWGRQGDSRRVRTIALKLRDERLGSLHLLDPAEPDSRPDPLLIVAAHMATAIDNSRRYEEALHLAEKDPLTGLYNHRGIHKRLAAEILNAHRAGTRLSLLAIDLDDFKMLNDTYGHPTGDAVLRHTAGAIVSVLRESDLAGRVGGDELLIVLPNTGSKDALQVGTRLRDFLMSNPYIMPAGRVLYPRLSQGCATYPTDAGSLEELLEMADASLYRSKESGGNTLPSVEREAY